MSSRKPYSDSGGRTVSDSRLNLDREFENTLNVALENIDANPVAQAGARGGDEDGGEEMDELRTADGVTRKTHPATRGGEGVIPNNDGSDSTITQATSLLPSGKASYGGDGEGSTGSGCRLIYPGMTTESMPTNAISNAKYNAVTFLPLTLYEQFKFFFNLYFLLVALSQAIPALRIGYLSSYVVPLVFVLTITLFKEAADDIQRRRRDSEQNSQCYTIIGHAQPVRARDLKCGDLVRLRKGVRVPADVVLVRSSEAGGETFVKTDQLDGETDWKLRLACALTQGSGTGSSESETSESSRTKTPTSVDGKLVDLDAPKNDSSISNTSADTSTIPVGPSTSDTMNRLEGLDDLRITAEAPSKSIHHFLGRLSLHGHSVGLTVDNTAWANTVVATGEAIGCVIYTGRDTRQAMNTSTPRAKTGLLELEINRISKILCLSVLALSIGLVVAHAVAVGPPAAGDVGGTLTKYALDVLRFLILFSSIIPVSLRVNLDLGKSVYAHQIEHDTQIPDTIVRTSTIPEDLGRIEYLLSDKTGTLTCNEMKLKKLHLGTVSFGGDTMDMVTRAVAGMSTGKGAASAEEAQRGNTHEKSTFGRRRTTAARVRNLILTLALCHSVTPTSDNGKLDYQASSPDEVAIVRFTESVGLALVARDRHKLVLRHSASGRLMHYSILYTFPFNSDTKRMGVVVRNESTGECWFLQKGADTVMAPLVQTNDWLEEETNNMAREGLRTLVIARKRLSKNAVHEFAAQYSEAGASMADRDVRKAAVVRRYLEHDLELQGLTGVEDKLQKNVKGSIEALRNAGIKIWMLTGDKVETARCVAVSAKLIARGQYVHTITGRAAREANESIGGNPSTTIHSARDNHLGIDNSDNFSGDPDLAYLSANPDSCLLIDGESLGFYMTHYRAEFCAAAVQLPAVIACRCTPQQKADVAQMIKDATGRRVCCIGDGGNDVSMIQCADVGVGIVGKEGHQASLAADFSITQFCHLTKLLMWHGRNSYKRSAKLSQFVIHRGLIISVCQAVYSICSSFEPLALYQGWLMVGYATLYTMAPVFSLVLDYDVSEDLVTLYPELYQELTEGKALSYRTFFAWTAVSLYQGIVVQGLSQVFVGLKESVFTAMVAISYSSLIFNELIMVVLEIHTWCQAMVWSELLTLASYVGSVPFLTDYFDLHYVFSVGFLWQLTVILALSLGPIWAAKAINRKLRPPTYAKVQQA